MSQRKFGECVSEFLPEADLPRLGPFVGSMVDPAQVGRQPTCTLGITSAADVRRMDGVRDDGLPRSYHPLHAGARRVPEMASASTDMWGLATPHSGRASTRMPTESGDLMLQSDPAELSHRYLPSCNALDQVSHFTTTNRLDNFPRRYYKY